MTHDWQPLDTEEHLMECANGCGAKWGIYDSLSGDSMYFEECDMTKATTLPTPAKLREMADLLWDLSDLYYARNGRYDFTAQKFREAANNLHWLAGIQEFEENAQKRG